MKIEAGVLKEVENEDIKNGSVVVPENVKHIGDSAFSKCDRDKVKHIELPKSLKTIGRCAFIGCKALETIEIPNGVREIGVDAFDDCKSLNTIEIPKSVVYIEDECFVGCTKLRRFVVNDNPCYITSRDGRCLIEKETQKAIGFAPKGLKEYKIPKGIKRLGGIFECDELESLEITSEVEEIPGGIFACDSLKSVKVPEKFVSTFRRDNGHLADDIEDAIALMRFKECYCMDRLARVRVVLTKDPKALSAELKEINDKLNKFDNDEKVAGKHTK